MSVTNQQNASHSADVQMHLAVNSHIFSIGQLGPDFLILDDPADHPPDDAEITLSIDGQVRRWRVTLPDGISHAQPRTRIGAAPVNGSTVG